MTRMISFGIIATALLSLNAASTPAQAQTRFCAPRDVIVEKLESQFKETRRSYGLQKAAGVFEVYASDSGSWTMILTEPSGVTCVLAVGEAWSEDESPAAEGDPA